MDTLKIIKNKRIVISALLVTIVLIGIFFWISDTKEEDPIEKRFRFSTVKK